MSRIDINIIDRGTQGSDWVAASKGLTADDIDKVTEQQTDNCGALNSLPTPFARFFVAKEAFRRVTEEHINPNAHAGFAYRQMVSSILDVYEILFYRTFHENSWPQGQKIEVREWDSVKELANLKEKMPILYNAVSSCYSSDINQPKLFFVVLTIEGHDILLGTSSPLTGFVTPPDMDKFKIEKNNTTSYVFAGEQYNTLQIHRKSGGTYFRDVKMFEERDKLFKNYMYYTLFGPDNVDSSFKVIKDYIKSFQNDPDIRNDYKVDTRDFITDFNNPLIINGLTIKASNAIDINNYFTSSIIRLPYRIQLQNFKAVTYENDVEDRTYDYLLPFKPEVMELFKGEEIKSTLRLSKRTDSVTVKLEYNSETYTKEYALEPLDSRQGKIFDLQTANINFDLGLFPNILSSNKVENNYFKVMVVAADEDPESPNFNIDQISLKFFRNNQDDFFEINEVSQDAQGVDFGVEPAVVRSKQRKEGLEGGTKFYELFNSSFEVLEVQLLNASGLLIPQWRKSQQTTDSFTYAIDLGTSNTFISRCKDGENNMPELFSMKETMVSYLHEVPSVRQYSIIKCIEDSFFERAKNRVKTEFLPAYIDGTDYKFPIRTALCDGQNNSAKESRLFDTHNIAFFYEKFINEEDQRIHTDIKWDADSKNNKMLEIFIQELLLIIKCDILQRNGTLADTHLIWFRPLSFAGKTRSLYRDLWSELPKKTLFVEQDKVKCYTESEAPYYYFKKKAYIPDTEAVTVIDIGGGSTDFVYFKDNLPKMASSIHFGCDVLWENGFKEFDNERENGIYKKYADGLKFISRPDLEEINICMKNIDKVKTKDIINFWLSNAKYCDITTRLNDDFKPLFAYHLTSILFYMSYLYKEKNLPAPKTIVFSGNGSRYIDNFICREESTLKNIINLIFAEVFGGEHNVNLKLPTERKESTCYGGLYRNPDAETVPEVVYQGDCSKEYTTLGDILNNMDVLTGALQIKYAQFSKLYAKVINLLKSDRVLENTDDIQKYINAASEDMMTAFKTYFRSQVQEPLNSPDIELYDSVFFIPIINKIFEMTKL